MARKSKNTGRVVHVECSTPTGYRWLRQHVRGATPLAQGDGFLVTNEAQWAQCLTAADGKEIA